MGNPNKLYTYAQLKYAIDFHLGFCHHISYKIIQSFIKWASMPLQPLVFDFHFNFSVIQLLLQSYLCFKFWKCRLCHKHCIKHWQRFIISIVSIFIFENVLKKKVFDYFAFCMKEFKAIDMKVAAFSFYRIHFVPLSLCLSVFLYLILTVVVRL